MDIARKRVVRLFQYIAELNKARSKSITDFYALNSYEWRLFLSDIPESSKYISLFYKDVDANNTSNILLSVKKPELPICPVPDDNFKDWLHREYDDAQFQGELFITKRPKSTNVHEPEFEYFNDSKTRTEAFNNWVAKRNVWVEQYKELKKSMTFLFYSMEDLRS